MSLFDGVPINWQEPEATERPWAVTLKRASNGADILICSVAPPPPGAIAEAKKRGLAIFTLSEIPAIRQASAADPRVIDHIITARLQFGYGGPITTEQL